MAISIVDILAAACALKRGPPGVRVPELCCTPCRGSKSYESASMSSLIVKSFNNLIANNSQIIARVLLIPIVPG